MSSKTSGQAVTYSFPVHVLSDKGAVVGEVSVCVVPRSSLPADSEHPYDGLKATHTHRGGGNYSELAKIKPTVGEWLLVVAASGRSPVVQPFELRLNREGDYVAVPTPSAVATVTINASSRGAGEGSHRSIGFHVKLYEAAELVYLAGLDYHQADVSGGWQFDKYGFARAEALRRQKKIHEGTIVTVFSTAKIRKTTRVWGAGRWVDIEVLALGDPSRRKKRPEATYYNNYEPDVDVDLHIGVFYLYLADVGAQSPFSVKDVGIFGHAFPGGPILYNTSETSAYRGQPPRDPSDFDGRPKDFDPPSYSAWRAMKSAFSRDCRFTLWGCNAVRIHKHCSREALRILNRPPPKDQKKHEEEEFFTARVAYERHLPGGRTEPAGIIEKRTSEPRHRWAMDRTLRFDSYGAAAAERLGIEVRGGCPGTSAGKTFAAGIEMLGINLHTYQSVYEYMRRAFGSAFDATHSKWDTGYVDYARFRREQPEIEKPEFSPRFYELVVSLPPTPRPATLSCSTITFENGKKYVYDDPIMRVESRRMDGFPTEGVPGYLYSLYDARSSLAANLMVQADGHVFLVKRPAGYFTVEAEVR